ncbi:MAG: CBS domain-containing protein [Chitinophagaceae bacterium]|nr:CBS domain-containing protein [Chitinophagaceae bacterium]
MPTVRNIIQSKSPVFNTIHPKALVIEGLQLLNTVNLSYLVVLDEDVYKGLFSERDYTRNIILKGRSSASSTIEEVMTVDLPRVEMDDTVEHCMNIMETHKTRYLLAFDDIDFKGVITIHDLLRQVIASKEFVFDHQLAKRLIDNDESPRIY